MADKVVIFVDDEKTVLDTLSEQLIHLFPDGFECETAESAAEGLEVLEELLHRGVTVVVVVSDWLMPGKKGDEFLAEVRTRFPMIGRILLTGHADLQALQRARASAAVQQVLFKPWRPDELGTAILQAALVGT